MLPRPKDGHGVFVSSDRMPGLTVYLVQLGDRKLLRHTLEGPY